MLRIFAFCLCILLFFVLLVIKQNKFSKLRNFRLHHGPIIWFIVYLVYMFAIGVACMSFDTIYSPWNKIKPISQLIEYFSDIGSNTHYISKIAVEYHHIIFSVLFIFLTFQCSTCIHYLTSYNKKNDIKKQQNSSHNFIFVMLLYILVLNSSYRIFDTCGLDYYIGTSGSDENTCSKSNQCLTYSANNIKENINIDSNYSIYINDQSSLSYQLTISQVISPRIFRNSYSSNSIYSIIQINSGGWFFIKGNAQFLGINFTSNGASNKAGGAIYAYLESQGELNISNSCFYKFKKCAEIGGAIYVETEANVKVSLSNLQFIECEATEGGGGLCASIENRSQLIIAGNFSFTRCISTERGGAMILLVNTSGIINFLPTKQILIDNCSSNSGGGILLYLQNNGTILLSSSKLINCSSNGDGGGLQTYLDNSQLSIKDSSFASCISNQNGVGGAMYIYHNDQYSQLFIINSTFTNCKTRMNPEDPKRAPGGAICLYYFSASNNLNSSRLQLKDLSFTGCHSITGFGHNIQILSPNTRSIGQQIKNGQLLTVHNSVDLYTSPSFACDYTIMDYNQIHKPLFEQFFSSNVPNPSYIDANNGEDVQFCGGLNQQCQKIAYTIGRNPVPLSGIIPSKDTNFQLILSTDALLDNNLQINIPTLYNNNITIKSNQYSPDAQRDNYIKRSIRTFSQNYSLIQITQAGYLELLGLHFDNLLSSSKNPLISISTNNNKQIPTLIIVDCEFNQDSTSYPDFPLSHSIIQINGGNLIMKNIKMQNYQFNNQKSLIIVESKLSNITRDFHKNQIEIINSNVSNILQYQIESGKGSVINAELKKGSLLQINDSSSFINCLSGSNGGAIYADINGGQVELSKVTMTGCQSLSGGAIYVFISNNGKLIINNSSEFYQCIAMNGNGGSLYIDMNFETQSNFEIKDATFHECQSNSSSSSSVPPTGYGAAIFLTGNGNYNPSSQVINMHGMKLYNNQASQGGQSLFVAISKLKELCQQSIAGQYVKGNYSNITSNLSMLEGISVDQSVFNILKPQQILNDQQHLQYFWSQIATLSKANVSINKYDNKKTLQFTFEGKNMIQGKLNVKFIEIEQNLGAKYIIVKNRLQYDTQREFIYPPEDGTAEQILIEEQSDSKQTASFIMKKSSWFNFEKKQYAVLVSNDRRIFTGIDRSEGKAQLLEVDEKIIQQDEQHHNLLEVLSEPIVILIIGLFASLFIIFIIVYRMKVNKQQQQQLINTEFNTSWKKSDFERKERLGNGAFGVVRHVIEKRTQIHMAWKEVNYETLKEKQLVDNEVTLMREIYRKIKHNLPPTSFYHIVQLLGFFVNEDKAYLVMEYYERGDLRKYINELRKMGADIKDKKCYEIVGQLAQSLNQLHRNEILHGDLKPENVLLTQDLKLTSDWPDNFRLVEDTPQITGSFQSTRNFKIKDNNRSLKREVLIQTPACDIWAFGVMIFELLAQRHPFYDNNEDLNEQEFAQRVINQPPAQLPDNYPLKLKNLIKQMLIKDPVHRISAEQILQNPEVAAALPQI